MNFEEIIEKDGYLIYTNVGISMMPTIREGKDLLVIEKIKRPLKKYDAVLFTRDNIEGRGHYVLHRIIKVNKDNTYYIQGDHSSHGEIVKRDNIIGILTKIKRENETIDCYSTKHQIYVRYIWLIYPYRMFKKKLVKLLKKLGIL